MIVILSLKIGSINETSLKENTINAFDKSSLIPAKYLSSNSSFWVPSVKWVKIEIISRPCSVWDTLSISSINIIAELSFVTNDIYIKHGKDILIKITVNLGAQGKNNGKSVNLKARGK